MSDTIYTSDHKAAWHEMMLDQVDEKLPLRSNTLCASTNKAEIAKFLHPVMMDAYSTRGQRWVLHVWSSHVIHEE
jgi:hypothetical protein